MLDEIGAFGAATVAREWISSDSGNLGEPTRIDEERYVQAGNADRGRVAVSA